MKIFLTLSLLLNVYLLTKVLNTSSPGAVNLETQAQKKYVTDKIGLKAAAPSQERRGLKKINSETKASDQHQKIFNPPPVMLNADWQSDFEVTIEKVVKDREEFLTGQLDLSATQLTQMGLIKSRAFEKMAEIYANPDFKDYHFDDRRRVLEVEEKMYQDLQSLVGKKKWQSFLKFREKYNNSLLDDPENRNGPVPFMEL